MRRARLSIIVLLGACSALAFAVQAKASSPPICEERKPGQRPVEYDSIEVLPDRTIRFHLCAPLAAAAVVMSTEIQGVPAGSDGKPSGLEMMKDALGYWTATTTTPTAPGPYRYAFRVDGVQMADPQGVNFSEDYRGVRSVLEVPGDAAAFETFQPGVPHGLVSTVEYWSTSLGRVRRAHVYTPPGYEGDGYSRLPVLYLVHGAGDSDDSWTSIGHANDILDNLIAAGKARPMIVVMPFGHTPAREGVGRINTDFGKDLLVDLVPFVDAHFRTEPKPSRRAMAGLSMGGSHTLQFGMTHPEVFGPIGVFSMGFYTADQAPAYIQNHDSDLRRRALSHELIYYAIGKSDALYPSVAVTRKVLEQYGIVYRYHESDGGHIWPNWRNYLAEFLPMLFH